MKNTFIVMVVVAVFVIVVGLFSSMAIGLSDDNETCEIRKVRPTIATNTMVSRKIAGESWTLPTNKIATVSEVSTNKNTTSTAPNPQLFVFNNRIPVQTNGSGYEHDLLQILSAKVVSLSQPFDASHSSSTSPQCRLHSKQFLEALKNMDLWALKMYDSSAKMSSGLLNGNINYFGDFDQCMSVVEPSVYVDDGGDQWMPARIRGKYCLAYLQASVQSDRLPMHRYLHNLLQSHRAFTSEFDDPGHRVPRFSLINWALCVPSTCTAIDVENSLKEYVHAFTQGTGIEVKIRVEPEMCQQKSTLPYDRNTKLAALFFAVIVVLAILSTIVEFKSNRPNPWLIAFSLRKNVLALCSLDRDPSDIKSIHGIRFLNAVLLMVSHKSMALFFDPYINRTQMTESLGQPWTVIGRAAAIYTDVFLLFSGLLTSYALIGRLQRHQSTRLVQEYIGRFMRIVPTLGALILFCTYILPNLASGPQWNLVVTHHADICKQHWWKNLLFIHNYFGFENMCLTHTHHLGIDTELFVVAPAMVLILWRWPKRGAALLLALAALSTAGRFHVTVVEKLSNYVYFGTSIQRLFKTADFMYSLPLYRATIYILGILLGYILRIFKNYKLSKTQLKMGWYISSVLFVIAFFGPAPMGSISYVYNEYHAAVYAAFGPMAWCGLFAWIVFTSHLGYYSFLSNVLSWRGFLVTTRLSYAIYLTQFPVFFFNVGRRRHAGYFDFISDSINVHEYFFILLTSAVLTLLFDTPFQNIKKILFNNGPARSASPLTVDANGTNDRPTIVVRTKKTGATGNHNVMREKCL